MSRSVLEDPNAIGRGVELLGSVLHPSANTVPAPRVNGIVTVIELDNADARHELMRGHCVHGVMPGKPIKRQEDTRYDRRELWLI